VAEDSDSVNFTPEGICLSSHGGLCLVEPRMMPSAAGRRASILLGAAEMQGICHQGSRGTVGAQCASRHYTVPCTALQESVTSAGEQGFHALPVCLPAFCFRTARQQTALQETPGADRAAGVCVWVVVLGGGGGHYAVPRLVWDCCHNTSTPGVQITVATRGWSEPSASVETER
jgi:hypothetical protein